MKKAILVISVLTVVVVTLCAFVGCGNVNQLNMLTIGWLDYESFVYNVYVDGTDTPIGEMTYTVKRLKNATETTPVGSYTVSSGGYSEYDLKITEDSEYAGSTLYSKVIFDSKFSPIASYKKLDSSNNSLDYEISVDYSGKKKGTITINGETSEFKKSGNTYDNDCIYTVIRGSVFDGASSYSLSMSTPANESSKTRSVSVAKIGINEEITSDMLFGESKVVKCSVFRASTPATYGDGAITTIAFSEEAQTVEGKSVIKVPVKIVEGSYSYVIKEIKLS